MLHRNTSFPSIATATFSAIFIRPAVIATNAFQLVIAGFLALALHLFSSPDGRILSLLQTWAAASWFQISRNLIAYLPEWLAMRLSRAWSSSMDKARTRHTYILGMSGSGKSVTMEMFLYRDVRNRRSGWDAPSLRLAFTQFLSGRFLPPEDQALLRAAEQGGHDLPSLRAELKRLEDGAAVVIRKPLEAHSG